MRKETQVPSTEVVPLLVASLFVLGWQIVTACRGRLWFERSKAGRGRGTHEGVKSPGLTLLSLETMELRSRYWEEEKQRRRRRWLNTGSSGHGGFSGSVSSRSWRNFKSTNCESDKQEVWLHQRFVWAAGSWNIQCFSLSESYLLLLNVQPPVKLKT